jgi:predicted DNA-binding WGR domain protein
MKRNMIAHYQGGGSDKVYIACIRQQANGEFAVIGKFGRRGGNMQVQIKGTYATLGGAQNAMQILFNEKLNKGYRNIENGGYNGPVTIGSVQSSLEAEPGVTVTTPVDQDQVDINEAAKNSTQVQQELTKNRSTKLPVAALRVVCINNLGIEDRFDLDAEYDAKTCKSAEMLVVTDRNGKKDEYFAERFRKIA